MIRALLSAKDERVVQARVSFEDILLSCERKTLPPVPVSPPRIPCSSCNNILTFSEAILPSRA